MLQNSFEVGRSRQITGGVGSGFQGDMNEMAKMIYRTSGNPPSQGQNLGYQFGEAQLRQPNPGLFNEDFLKIGNEHSQPLIPQQRNNENMNIINGIFGNPNGGGPNLNNAFNIATTPGAVAQSVADSERERRLKLREMERLKRMEGISGGDYGQLNTSVSTTAVVPPIFGGPPSNSALNKREQVWQQKFAQRASSQDRHNRPQQQHSQIQLPVYQQPTTLVEQTVNSHSSDKQVRSSRVMTSINDAIKLDQSLNYQDYLAAQQQAQKPPLQNQNQGKPPTPQHYANPLLGGDDDVIKKRREAERVQRQKEYNEYIQKQNKSTQPSTPQSAIISNQPSLQIQQPISQPHSSNSSQRQHASENPLSMAGGFNLLGMHQLKKEEDKQRMQREYKQMLDQQTSKPSEAPASQASRRKELSDQVFSELLNPMSLGNPNPSYPPPPSFDYPLQFQQPLYPQGIPIAQSVKQVDQMKQDNVVPNFFKQRNEDEIKKVEIDKKRQYAIELQQQIAAQQKNNDNEMGGSSKHRRRGASIQQPHQQVSLNEPIMSMKSFDYQPQIQQQYIQPQQYAPMPGQYNMMPPGFNPQLINPVQLPDYSSYQQQVQAQPQPMMKQDLDPQAQQSLIQRQKQEDYRRELESQIKMKEEQKRLKIEQEKILQQLELAPQQQRQPPNNMIPQFPQAQILDGGLPLQFRQGIPEHANIQHQQPPVVRPQKITQNEDEGNNQDRKSRQQQYQEELQKQVEERKRLKEEEKRKQQLEDEIIERKMKQQQDELNQRENNELIKEGRGVKEERKRKVRRDQFEPSSDNPTVVNQYATQKSQLSAVEQQPSDPWTKAQQMMYGDNQAEQKPSIQLPIESRKDDLFGRAPAQIGGGFSQQPSYGAPPQFGGMPPPQIIQPSYQEPPSYYQSSQVPLQQQQFQRNNFDQMPQFNQPSQQFPMNSARISNPGGLNEEDYGKMISMYQRAFSEIIDFKNQYMEEVMRMRERVIKEREEILEYERVKHQQHLEIQNLKAVYDRLGDMMRPEEGSHQGPKINPMVQTNLNNLLMKQQQDIMRMSQNGMNGFNLPQVNVNQQQQYQGQQIQFIPPSPGLPYNQNKQNRVQESPNILEQSLSSDTKFVVVPQNKLASVKQNLTQLPTDLQSAGVKELMQTWDENQILNPPQQNIQQEQFQVFTSTQGHQSLAGSSQFITGHHQTPLKGASILTQSKAPLVTQRPQSSQSGMIPETIQEMPSHQEDDSKLEDRKSTYRAENLPHRTIEDEHDFNSRESSKSRDGGDQSSQRQQNQLRDQSNYILVKQESSSIELRQNQIEGGDYMAKSMELNTMGNTIQDNIAQIEKILNQNPYDIVPKQQQVPQQKYSGPLPISLQSQMNVDTSVRQQLSDIKSPTSSHNAGVKNQMKTQDKFHSHAGASSSSFYNATMQLQKQQEQTQQEELQKQLMRIYGASQNQEPPLVINRSQIKPAETQQQKQLVTPIQPVQHAHQDDEHDLLMQTNINIADSMNEETQKNLEALAFKVRAQENNRVAPIQIKRQEEPEEVKMNERPKINEYKQHQQQYPQNQYNASNRFQSTVESQLDIWNDPDLVPPPVVMIDEEDDFIEEQEPVHFDDDDGLVYHGGQRQQLFKHHHHHQRQISGQESNTSINAGTINQLQMFSPPSQVDAEEDSRINLGTYNNQHFTSEFDGENQQTKSIQPVAGKPSPLKRPPMSAKPPGSNSKQPAGSKPFALNLSNQPQTIVPVGPTYNQEHPYPSLRPEDIPEAGSVSDRSMSKKEREIIEIAKLIQKATDTTNTLFENTDNFKFRFKNRGEDEVKKQPVQQQDKDSDIMSNLDKIIQGLQEAKQQRPVMRSFTTQQQQQQQQLEQDRIQIANEDESEQQSVDPIRAMHNDSNSEIGLRIQRPITGAEGQQKSVGRFTQMALNNINNDGAAGKMLEEVSSRFGQRNLGVSPQNHQQQQVILRPVSGKSNSNRYGHIDSAAQASQRASNIQQSRPKSKSNDKRNGQPMFYDEESEDQINQ